MKQSVIFLMSICLIGLLLRSLPLVTNWKNEYFFMQDDSWGYDRIARNLQEGHGYSWKEKEPYEINVYRPPGMPLILLGIYTLFRPYVPYAILLQVLVGTAVILMTYLVGLRIFGQKTAFVAACFQALDPLSIVYSNLLLTEVFSSFFLICAAYLTINYVENGRRSLLILVGLLVGVSTMIHPISLFLPLFVLILPLFSSRTRVCRHFAIACIGMMIGITPAVGWMVRNVKVADYGGISCVAAVSLMKYKAAGVLADINGTELSTEADKLEAECEANLPANATRGARFRAWQSKGISILVSHPVTYAKLHLKGVLLEFFGPGRDHLTQMVYGSRRVLNSEGRVTDGSIREAVEKKSAFHLDLIRLLALGIQVLTYAFFFIGNVVLLMKKRFALVIGLFFPLVYVWLLSGGPESSSRFRVIYMPFVCIIAGFGLRACLDFLRKYGRDVKGI